MLRKSSLLAVLHLLMALLFSASALADAEYAITKYSMTIDVLENGDANVTETMIYKFDGEYNGILSVFDTDGLNGIEDMRLSIDGEYLSPVSEMNNTPNTYTLNQDGNLIEIRAYSPGESDMRFVQYEYRMVGLANRYEDTGMILRVFIGENNSVSLQDAVVRISFSTKAELQAFVHGGMEAEDISLGENFVEFGPKTIQPKTSVKMRILFPGNLIAAAPLQETAMLNAALSEETQLIEKAQQRALFIKTIKYIFSFAYLSLFFLLWLLMVKKYGRKNQLYETPDVCGLMTWPAAFAAVAVSDAPDTDSLSGTLIELVQLGRVSMEASEGDLLFTILNRTPDGLYPHQRSLIEWLFESGNTFYLSSLHAGTDYERAQSFENGYTAYCSQVMRDMQNQKLKYRNDGLRITINALLIILGTIGTSFILIADAPNLCLGCSVFLLMFLFIYLMSRIRTLTDEGERLQKSASALISDGIMPDRLIPYLPFYTALGMTEPLIEAVDSNMSVFSTEDAPYLFSKWPAGLHQLTDSMRVFHLHNASLPSSDASSFSSSDSGSNGSGGGHGAW